MLPTPHKCRFTAWAFTKPKASKAWTWRLDFNEGFISFAAPYTKYRFTVRAFTKRREGPTSEALVVITDTEAPSPPRSVHKWRHNFFAKIWTLPLPIQMDSEPPKKKWILTKSISRMPKGGFMSEDTGGFLHCQIKYSKSLSWAENLNKLSTDLGGKFKFSAQDSDLEYLIWQCKNYPVSSDF